MRAFLRPPDDAQGMQTPSRESVFLGPQWVSLNDEVNAMKIVVREDGKTYERHERIREMAYYTPWGRETQVEVIVEYRECDPGSSGGPDQKSERENSKG